MRTLLLTAALTVASATSVLAQEAPPDIQLVDAFPGERFTRPVFLTEDPSAAGRFVVVEQGGRVLAVERDGVGEEATFTTSVMVDLSARVSRGANEEGLFGIAFHPDYPADPRVFVHYSAAYSSSANRRGVLASLERDADDAARFDIATLDELLVVPQPFTNHNGGMIAFGPDDKLYLALGDGGSGGDPQGHGQNLGTLLATILRLDIDDVAPGQGYSIPADNPFVARPGARGEIWAYGLRNPWRFSFDRSTGFMWAADVGQSRFEEVDVVVAGGNYGWKLREGPVEFQSGGDTPADPLRDPVAAYGRGLGQSVTGGYVYRGAASPGLQGVYIYADFATGRMFGIRPRSGVVGVPQGAGDVHAFEMLASGERIASFGEDAAGELYVCSFGGRVLRIETDEIVPPDPDEPLPEKLSALGLFESIPRLRPISRALRYDVNSPLWSDGAAKQRFIVLPPTTSITYAARDAFSLPVGAIAVKSFLVRARRGGLRAIETRVIRQTDGGSGVGFDVATYVHDPDGQDATRLDERDETVLSPALRSRPWLFPSPEDCRACHAAASGFLIGITAEQLRHPGRLSRRRDLIADWAAAGSLTGVPEDVADRDVLVSLTARVPVERRVRSYLASNCAGCHRPEGTEPAGLDLRSTTPLALTGLTDTAPLRGDLDIVDARVVAPGAPARSVLIERMKLRGQEEQMPPLGSHRLDRRALRVFTRWVRGLR